MKNIDPLPIIIIVVTVLILTGAAYFGVKMGAREEITTNGQMEVLVDSNKYDWGTINMDGGIVSKSFSIENKSNIPLKLYDVKTSCMCTTAQLKTSDKSSKKFGMHEKTKSIFEVKAGETAELLVEFDPAFHGPSGIGPIHRTVTMKTNDAKHPSLSFELTAKVIK